MSENVTAIGKKMNSLEKMNSSNFTEGEAEVQGHRAGRLCMWGLGKAKWLLIPANPSFGH